MDMNTLFSKVIFNKNKSADSWTYKMTFDSLEEADEAKKLIERPFEEAHEALPKILISYRGKYTPEAPEVSRCVVVLYVY